VSRLGRMVKRAFAENPKWSQNKHLPQAAVVQDRKDGFQTAAGRQQTQANDHSPLYLEMNGKMVKSRLDP